MPGVTVEVSPGLQVLDVAVIGAGIAGLVTAHLLSNAGHAVTVIERDDDATHTAGYRLHLDPAAVNVLRTALSQTAYEFCRPAGRMERRSPIWRPSTSTAPRRSAYPAVTDR